MNKKIKKHTSLGNALFFRDSMEISFEHGSHEGVIVSSYICYDIKTKSYDYYNFFGNRRIMYNYISELVCGLSASLPGNPTIELYINSLIITTNGQEEIFWQWFTNQNTIKIYRNFFISK